MEFKITDQFYKDGEPTKIISGAIHYFRSHHDTWEDKLRKLKALGCNTVETYVPWNLHQPEVDKFDFTGNLNLEYFIKLATSLDLMIILRFTPYICAEHDFGGLPWWLCNIEGIKYRCDNRQFLNAVERYMATLIPLISKHQVSKGGNIILGQLENEYGSYGNDKQYLKKLLAIYRKHGFEMPLVTSDGSWSNMLESGTLFDEGIIPTVNFGSDADKHFDILEEKFNKKYPSMCMEFWCGWFDAWGYEKPKTDSPQKVAEELDKILNRGSVNFYMFHGGTNFGFQNGANLIDEKDYKPHTASYDYDALLDEAGNVTEKYNLCKAVISKYTEVPNITINPIQFRSYGKLSYQGSASLFDNLQSPVYDVNTLNMEAFGQGYGYAVYESQLTGINHINTIMLCGLRDRANIYIDERLVATTYYHADGEPRIDINCDVEEGSIIKILVENTGRVSYGPKLGNARKGILEGVFIDAHYHYNWNHYKVDMSLDTLSKLEFGKSSTVFPNYHRYSFEVDILADTYLDMSPFGKGVVFVNGVNIGRFWDVGPQYQLHISSPFLKLGENEVIVFETESKVGELWSVESRH